MSWEIAIVGIYVGTAFIFAYLSMQTNTQSVTGSWFKTLFLLMCLINVIVLFDMGGKIIDFQEQTNTTITGLPTNATLYNNLRVNVFSGYYMIIPIFVLLISIIFISVFVNTINLIRKKGKIKGEDSTI